MPEAARWQAGPVACAAVDEPSAWRGPELSAGGGWVRRFTDTELAELDAAVAAVRARGLAPFGFSRRDFPLPTLAGTLAQVSEEIENGRGLVMLRGLDVTRFEACDLQRAYAGIGVHLGRAIRQNARGDRLGRVTDLGTDYGRVSRRGHTSNGEILPHCDSSDVVGLLCVQPALRGGESKVASATTVYNLMLAEHPEYAAPLALGFHINLAGKGPTGSRDECSRHPIPVFSHFAGRLSCRYNAKQILDAASILSRPLSALQRAAVQYVGETAMRDDVRLDMDFEPGDIQLLNNHCMLHARGAFEDHPEPARRRLLLRMWLNTPGSRALAPDFADRLNTGPRGEVALTAL